MGNKKTWISIPARMLWDIFLAYGAASDLGKQSEIVKEINKTGIRIQNLAEIW